MTYRKYVKTCIYSKEGEEPLVGGDDHVAQFEKARRRGEMLRRARTKLGLTQVQAAEAAGIPTQSYLSAMERGRIDPSTSSHLFKLARALKMTTEEIKFLKPDLVLEVLETPKALEIERLSPSEIHEVPVYALGAHVKKFAHPDNCISQHLVTPAIYRKSMIVTKGDKYELEELADGAYLYVDEEEHAPEKGRIYLVAVAGDTMIKRCQRMGDSWAFVSDALDSEIYPASKVHIIGRVYGTYQSL